MHPLLHITVHILNVLPNMRWMQRYKSVCIQKCMCYIEQPHSRVACKVAVFLVVALCGFLKKH